MEEENILKILSNLKVSGEIPYIEIKESLVNKDQIGKTLSALSNSASYHDQEHGYMIWGIKDKTWAIVGTSFDIEKENEGKKGFILPQIIRTFNYSPQIVSGEFYVDGKRIYVLQIKHSGNQPLCFNMVPYIRIGEVNSPLNDSPIILKSIVNKSIDWSAQVPTESSFELIDEEAFSFLKSKYFEIVENQKKQLDAEQLLNALSLLDKKGKPNNTCLLFIGKQEKIKDIFRDKNKITWVYRDEFNGIEERLSVDEENLPFIFNVQNIINRINKFNTTLQDIDLFRNDINQYDEKAVEELIINAIVHRDWDINLWIEVIQTPNSLEIRNPGKFRADIDEVLIKNTRPEYLNPNLADFLKRMHLMEKEGGGLRKAYSAQIRRGLSIKFSADNTSTNPRVDFLLTGKVKDVNFARFMFATKELTQNQVVVLDKIYSGKNILNKDITPNEYLLVENLVSKSGKGGISLKIKEHLLKKSKTYINEFSSTHASKDTSKEIILDYAKKNTEFSTAEIYDVMRGKNKVWIRKLLMRMVINKELQRISVGVYKLSLMEQTKGE